MAQGNGGRRAVQMPARLRGWQEGLWSSVGPGAWALKVCPAFPPLQMESSLQVLMRQEDVLLGEAVCPGLLAPGLLPSMWQLYPGRRYRGSDSSFWRIVYHIEASVSLLPGTTGWPWVALRPLPPCLASAPSGSAPKTKNNKGRSLQLQDFKGLDERDVRR